VTTGSPKLAIDLLVRNAGKRKNEPQLGIFWLVSSNLVIDSTPLSEALPYGNHFTHPRGHLEVWTQFQQSGTVPADLEYEELPRGRVMYNTKTQRFSLLADKCILRDKGIISKIMSALCLPSENTDKGTDAHYRCSSCLRVREDD
jgi:hypothetical protein